MHCTFGLLELMKSSGEKVEEGRRLERLKTEREEA